MFRPAAAARREQFRRRFEELQDEHRRALAAGDIEALESVQMEVAELMKQAKPYQVNSSDREQI
jgi:hypothetical protein